MIKPTVFCDVCGKTKGDVNHWWIALSLSTERGTAMFMGTSLGDAFVLVPWNEHWATDKGSRHYCGEAHAQQALNEYMGSVKTEVQKG